MEEKRERALIQIAVCNQVVTRYYDKKFRPKIFKKGDLVLNKILVQEPRLGSFGPKRDGLFRVTEVIQSGMYRRVDQDRIVLGHPWNIDHLKCLYQ